jgi:hypothetical protein
MTTPGARAGGEEHQFPRQSRLLRCLRLISWPGSSWARLVDRAETAAVLALVIGFLVVAPFLALYTAHGAASSGRRDLSAERGWRQVSAVLRQDASNADLQIQGDWVIAWVAATWQGPDGRPQAGRVPVPPTSRVGQHVEIWVTSSGRLVYPPVNHADITAREVSAAVLAEAGLATATALLAGTVHLVANRRRLKGWAADWEATAPKWTSRRAGP